jgi:23S rRNA (uridine2552-2'-O)-methyltransferase
VKRDNPYQRVDSFTKAAKARGFPARSVFKLEEIDQRVRLLKGGQRVLDLGAAPGSWSLYAASKIGSSGRLLAIDLSPVSQALPPGTTFLQGDINTMSDETLGMYAPYDVVLSDMAPKTTGNRVQDQARSFDLFSMAMETAARFSAPGGSFVGKIFMGPDFEHARKRLRELYGEVRVLRPEGVRSVSFEVFLVGIGRKAMPEATKEAP